MVHFVALPKLPNAKFLVGIVSDQGLQFISMFWKEVCGLIGGTVAPASGYHPEMNDQLTMSWRRASPAWLRRTPPPGANTWCGWYTPTIPYPLQPGMSPFYCVFGYEPPHFPDTEKEITVHSAHAMVCCCHRIWTAVLKVLIRSRAQMKKAADRHHCPTATHKPGQKVWLSTK